MSDTNDQQSTRTHPFWLAQSFLLPGRAMLEDSPAWKRAPHWFFLWGLLIGIVYAAVFRAAWRWFGEYQYIRFIPVAMVLVVDLAWGGYKPFMAVVRLMGRRSAGEVPNDGPGPATTDAETMRVALVVTLIAILKYAMLLSLPLGDSEWPGWRSRMGILYPRAIYRPLLLMPLWGRWAAVLSLCMGRARPDATSAVVRMGSGVRLPWMALGWLACGTLTCLYACDSAADLPRGTLVALGVLVTAYLVSFVLAREFRGQSATTVLATAMAAEFAFLALYLPVVSNVFHY